MSSRSGIADLAVGGRLEVAVGESGVAALGAVLEELLADGDHSVAEVAWHPRAGRELDRVGAATVTVTRRSPAARPPGGLGLHLALKDADGEVAGDGIIRLVGPPSERFAVATDFAGIEWGQALADELVKTEFESATQTFDGSIGLQAGASQVQLRIYKGRCIDVSGSTPNGATFTIRGAEIEWVDLAFGPRNDFIARTMGGRFAADGDVFQYLRMNRAVNLVWDAVRSLAQEGQR